MNNVRISLNEIMIYSLFIFLFPSLLSSPRNQILLSNAEQKEIRDNANNDYIRVDRESSMIYDLIMQLICWEKNDDSLLYQLKDHIENGYSIGEYKAVTQALDYAALLLQQN